MSSSWNADRWDITESFWARQRNNRVYRNLHSGKHKPGMDYTPAMQCMVWTELAKREESMYGEGRPDPPRIESDDVPEIWHTLPIGPCPERAAGVTRPSTKRTGAALRRNGELNSHRAEAEAAQQRSDILFSMADHGVRTRGGTRGARLSGLPRRVPDRRPGTAEVRRAPLHAAGKRARVDERLRRVEEKIRRESEKRERVQNKVLRLRDRVRAQVAAQVQRQAKEGRLSLNDVRRARGMPRLDGGSPGARASDPGRRVRQRPPARRKGLPGVGNRRRPPGTRVQDRHPDIRAAKALARRHLPPRRAGAAKPLGRAPRPRPRTAAARAGRAGGTPLRREDALAELRGILTLASS
jgi:flagellar motility protein MotE (MotC chaperone)